MIHSSLPMLHMPIHKYTHKVQQSQPIQKKKNTSIIVIEDSDNDEQDSSINEIQLERPHYDIKDIKFLEIPVVRLTEDLIKDPYKLIDMLYAKDYDKIGIVKLIPPNSSLEIWENLQQKLGNKKLITRTQTLNHLVKSKPYVHNSNGFTVSEFIKQARQFEQSYKPQLPKLNNNQYRQNELEFWSIVDHPDDFKTVQVEYAADLLTCKYTSGFEDNQLLDLNKVNKLPNGMFQALKEKNEMSGISVPWLYLGMKFACFCWHCEDLYLNSMNYMHSGAPKTWYAIPPSQAHKFNEYFYQKYNTKANPKLLYDMNTMISPIELMNNKIKVLSTDQYPGELILTLGGTYHAGFSHGLNCSEAVNLAPIQWMSQYSKAVEEYRKNGNVHKVSFPLKWLLVKIILNIQDLKFSTENLKQDEVKQEIQDRNSVMKLYQNFHVYEFKNKNEKYDRHICKICSDYMFFSYLYCFNCLNKGCVHHKSVCPCADNKVALYIRYNDQELHHLEKILLKEIENS